MKDKKKPGPPKGTGGRPAKKIDMEQVDKLLSIQCTEVEIAAWFDMSIELLNQKIKLYAGCTFLEYSTQKKAKGKISLRRSQIRLALGDETHPPNPTMLIWLGKQYLEQAEKSEFAGPGGGPIGFRFVDPPTPDTQ
jgi:hypothetical protein